MDTMQTIILTRIVNIIITVLVGGVVIYTIQKKIDATIQKSLFEHQTRMTDLPLESYGKPKCIKAR